jgi:hypothetical protein
MVYRVSKGARILGFVFAAIALPGAVYFPLQAFAPLPPAQVGSWWYWGFQVRDPVAEGCGGLQHRRK